MTVRSRLLLTLAITAAFAGCSSHSDDLDGTWTGSDALSNGTALQDSLTLSSDNSTISGNFTATTTTGTTVYTGTISGTYNSPTYNFTITVVPGGVVGQATCSLQMNGTGTFVNSSGSTSPSKTLSGTFTTVPTGSCGSIVSTTDTFAWTMPG